MTTVRDDLGRLLVATSDQIAEMPWEPLGTDGVEHKMLWQSGDNVIGLIRVAPGASKPEHVHLGAHHHILMLQGTCDMVGQTLPTGSYIYIPPGVAHAVDNVGPEGCTFFYTYRPLEIPPRDDEPAGSPV